MKVFLSWSGARSHAVARAFHEWLPSVVQQADPWISSDSISKGDTWLSQVREALDASNGVGLFFLTNESLSSEWLLFEAGGIAALGQKRVCTVCIDMAPGQLKPPLNFFQATTLEQEDIFRLVGDLNQMTAKPVAQAILQKTLGRAWADLEVALGEAKKVQPPKVAKQEADSKVVEASMLEALRRIEARLGTQERALQEIAHGTTRFGIPTAVAQQNLNLDAIARQARDVTAHEFVRLAREGVGGERKGLLDSVIAATAPPPSTPIV